MNFHLKSLSACLPFLLLSCVALANPKNEAHGKVANADSLLRVRTICLDTSALSTTQLGFLKRVIKQAIKPKGVFTKLNWQLHDNCNSADATVKLNMDEREKESWDDAHAPAGAAGGAGGMSTVTMHTFAQAKMIVTQTASGAVFYQVDGKPKNDRVSAFESVFSKLLTDVQGLPH